MSRENGKNTKIEEYRQQLSAYAPGRWFQFPKDYLFIFSRDEAIALAVIIDAGDRFMALERYGGWFYYTWADMERDSGMDKNVQQRVVNSLIAKNVLEKKRALVPPKRFFKVRMDVLNDLVQKSRKERRKKERSRLEKEKEEYERLVVDEFLNNQPVSGNW